MLLICCERSNDPNQQSTCNLPCAYNTKITFIKQSILKLLMCNTSHLESSNTHTHPLSVTPCPFTPNAGCALFKACFCTQDPLLQNTTLLYTISSFARAVFSAQLLHSSMQKHIDVFKKHWPKFRASLPFTPEPHHQHLELVQWPDGKALQHKSSPATLLSYKIAHDALQQRCFRAMHCCSLPLFAALSWDRPV